MSLGVDWIEAGGAFAVAVGSAIQASQAFAELNAETPLTSNLAALFLASLVALFNVVIPKTNPTTMDSRLRALGFGQAQEDGHVVNLTAEQVKNLKKWLGLFLGWFFISLGALAALAAAAWMLAIDW